MLIIDREGLRREATPDEEAAFLASLPQPTMPPLPTLSRRQLLLGLLSIDIREADVEAKIALLPADQVEAAMIEWKDASEYKRDDPLVSTLATYFGLPANQVDALWTWAAAL